MITSTTTLSGSGEPMINSTIKKKKFTVSDKEIILIQLFLAFSDGQDFDTVLGYQYSVLELSSPTAIGSYSRPSVAENPTLTAT